MAKFHWQCWPILNGSLHGIIDYFKVIKKMLPLDIAYDVDSNSDGINDGQAFEWGLIPSINLKNYPLISKIVAGLEFQGYENYRTAKGDTKTRPHYRMEVSQIPLVNTLKFNKEEITYWDRAHSDPITDNERIRASTHEDRVNQILFIIKVRSYENNEKTAWLIKRQEIVFGNQQQLKINLKDFSYLRYIFK